ncbi:MAG TPA: molybdopterin-dependent oxidoreductase [Alphaproteobacteria bacterium]|nr:molybdopterin-dependent oxidoreductase [Alphaproteobacteria bacterium]
MIRFSAAISAVCLLASTAIAEPTRTESFAIKGGVDHPRTVTLADLLRETPNTVAISQKTNHGPLTGKFTGVLLWTLLQEAAVTLEGGKKNEMLRHFVVIAAADGYSTVLSLGEIAPDLGNVQVIVAYARDGKPIEGANGFARLIVPGDKEASRAISAISTIEVR